jgi:hypothetical protein
VRAIAMQAYLRAFPAWLNINSFQGAIFTGGVPGTLSVLGTLWGFSSWLQYRSRQVQMPADHKWFTRLAAAGLIYATLRDLKLDYPTVSEEQKKLLGAAKAKLESQGVSADQRVVPVPAPDKARASKRKGKK